MESGGTRAASVCAPTWRQGGARSRSMTSDSEEAAKTRHIESKFFSQASLLVAQIVGPERLRMTTNMRRASEGRCARSVFGLKVGNGVGRWAPPAATTGVKVGTAPISSARAGRLSTCALAGWWSRARAVGVALAHSRLGLGRLPRSITAPKIAALVSRPGTSAGMRRRRNEARAGCVF